MSIGEDGRAGEAIELAILSLSSTCSSLIPEKNALWIKENKIFYSILFYSIIVYSILFYSLSVSKPKEHRGNGVGWSTIYFIGIRRSFLVENIFSSNHFHKSHLGLGSLVTSLADGRFLQ